MAGEPYADLEPEDISSLMRIEKASGQLSEVRRDLYPAMRALQERMTRLCEKADPESLDYDLKRDRKKKLASNIKLVVEYRMNKVAAMALRGAMGTLNTVDNLPPEEREFYEECLESAKKLWNSPYTVKKTVYVPDIVTGEVEPITEPEPEVKAESVVTEPAVQPAAETPAVMDEPTEMEAPPDEMLEAMFPDEPPVEEMPADIPPIPEEELSGEAPAADTPAAEPQAEEPKAEAEEEQESEDTDENPYADCFDMVTVRMTETVEPFAGTERNYSLKKEDVVRLPKSLASILVGRNLAVILSI